MITQTVTVKEKGDQNIIIGRRGTYETEQIVFDVTYLIETFGDGVAMLMVKRPSDNYAYPATVERDGNKVIWTVSEVDTGVKGHGECELFWYVNDATGLAKSVIYSVAILRDIAETYTDPPEAWETWIDEMAELSAETMAYAEDAVDAAADALEAKADAVDAKDAAVIAQGAAETAAENAQSAAAHYPKIEGGYWYVWTNGAWVNTGVKAEGVDGKGITSVVGAKTSTSGLVDTYTMTVTYTDNTHDTITFTVTNGRDGTDGTDGVSPEVTITQITGGHTVTITDADHPSGQSFDVMDGEVTNAVLNAALQTKAPIIKDTATGSIVTFPDGTPGPMKIEATLEPIQDLHGYENPWPAGGGKNKLDISFTSGRRADITYTDNGDGTLLVYGTASSLSTYNISTAKTFPAGTYILNGSTVNTTVQVRVGSGSGTTLATSGNNTDVSFTLNEETALVCVARVTSGSVVNNETMKPMLRLSTETNPAWQPYSNECPISGHTGAEVWDDPAYGGLIQWNQYQGTVTSVSGSVSDITAVVDNGVVKITGTASATGNIGIYPPSKNGDSFPANHSLLLMATGKGNVKLGRAGFGAGVNDNYAFFKYTESFYCGVYLYIESGKTYDTEKQVMVFDLTEMFGEGNEPTTIDEFKALFPKDYYSYTASPVETCVSAVNGDPYVQKEITFPSTVYGGTLTVNEDGTGAVVATKALKDLGELSWEYNGTRFRGTIQGIIQGSSRLKGICSNYPIFNGAVSSAPDKSLIFGVDNQDVYIKDSAYTDEATFTTAMDGVTVCYDLATPVTIALTPGILSALQGANCVWIDAATGAITAVYPCDTKLYIDKKIAEILNAV